MACDVLPVGKFLTNFLAEMDHYDKKIKFLLFGGKKRARALLYVFGEFEPLTRLLDRHDISIRKRLGQAMRDM